MRKLVSAFTVALALFISAMSGVGAYEFQYGPGRNCGSWYVQIGAHVYGDGNLYSNYGWELGQYNVPYWTLQYLFQSTTHHSVSSTAAEAENYVPYSVGTDCTPV